MFGISGKFKTNFLNVHTKVHKLNNLHTPSSTTHDFFFNEYIVFNPNKVTNHKICTNLHINFKLIFCDFCFLSPFFFLLILFSSWTRFTEEKICPITWLVRFELICIHILESSLFNWMAIASWVCVGFIYMVRACIDHARISYIP